MTVLASAALDTAFETPCLRLLIPSAPSEELVSSLREHRGLSTADVESVTTAAETIMAAWASKFDN